MLDLCATGITALPAAIGALRALESLDLTANEIETVHPALYALPKLRKFICFNSGTGDRAAMLHQQHPHIEFED